MGNFKERINYVISEDGTYCGWAVNVPIVMQADNLDDLREKSKVAMQSFLYMMNESLVQEEPFDFKEQSNPQTLVSQRKRKGDRRLETSSRQAIDIYNEYSHPESGYITKDNILNAMRTYANEKCKEQRKICAKEYQNEIGLEPQIIINAPEPKFD